MKLCMFSRRKHLSAACCAVIRFVLFSTMHPSLEKTRSTEADETGERRQVTRRNSPEVNVVKTFRNIWRGDGEMRTCWNLMSCEARGVEVLLHLGHVCCAICTDNIFINIIFYPSLTTMPSGRQSDEQPSFTFWLMWSAV